MQNAYIRNWALSLLSDQFVQRWISIEVVARIIRTVHQLLPPTLLSLAVQDCEHVLTLRRHSTYGVNWLRCITLCAPSTASVST
jgi:hypothetical protein